MKHESNSFCGSPLRTDKASGRNPPSVAGNYSVEMA